MNATAVRLGSEHQLTAYILIGDGADPARAWVCVQADDRMSSSSWLGCWSRKSGPVSARDLRVFLALLDERIRGGAVVGPYGVALSGHYFFDGWDSWGPGLPAPMLDQPPSALSPAEFDYQSVEEFGID
ncbi:hypothetical protein GCM10027589_06400 [Actinocorallia lasiicapitis]